MDGFNASNVVNGTWGESWFDGQYMSQTTALSAEIDMKYEAVSRCRNLIDGQKMTGLEGKGSVKFHKVDSSIMAKVSALLKAGKTPEFTIISHVADPDAFGGERVALYNCKLDKMILADWESGKLGEEDYSFTFEDWKILDKIN